jgi:hypothetical protein
LQPIDERTMTMPGERAASLIRARELLLALSVLEEPVNVPALRSRAASLLRHYPDAGTIGLIADRTDWLETPENDTESRSLLTKKVALPPPPSSPPGESLRDESFFENFRLRELESLRAKVKAGDLLTADEFRSRLGLSEEALHHLVVEGSVFFIDVDGLRYFPSLLSDGRYNRARLFLISRIIWPAHPTFRLHYLTSRRGNLGGLTPLECLSDRKKFRLLKKMAWAETADSYRTCVRAYSGLHSVDPSDVSPVYEVAEDLDPRRNLWERGLAALNHHGYTGVFPPYQQLREATVFITQLKAGSSDPDEGAKLTFSIVDNCANVTVERFVSKKNHYLRVPLGGEDTIEDAMRTVFREVWNRGAF